MREFFLNIPYFGLLLTLGSYWFGQYLYRKTGWTILQPILVSAIIIMAFLSITGIPFDVYYDQNYLLNYILPLTAVVLALPLYHNLHILKRHALPIVAGVLCGTITTMGVMIAVAKLIGTDTQMILTMLPKNCTNPIAIEVSRIIGGIPNLTVALVVVAGLLGSVFGPELLTLMRIKNKVARGIAIGSMSHAVGTSRAFKESEIEGSMSSLALALTGTLVAILSPIVATFL